ncbi:hypothetical protein DL770_008074 [Monosporascus sp. CRB-9-2]|nr:hypothetical protein DL770_008074 [Monosporascus sp. CRB-9-2]
MRKREFLGLLTILGLAAQLVTPQLTPDCNPLKTTCPPNRAWPEENYYIDFTKETELPPNWVIASHETVRFTPNGAEFAYAERKNAPHLWTDFYMLGGRYDVEMKIAPGQGIVSSAVLWSDVQDEIDWEFTGNQHGVKPFPPPDGQWTVETNVFSHGKMWDGATAYQKEDYKPTEQFHTYSVEWDENGINWYVDNRLTRSLSAKDTPQGFVFPSSPMKLQIGIWGGGDPDNNDWTVQWAGGEIDSKGLPYTAYVKNVNITNKYPACEYRYEGKVDGPPNNLMAAKDGQEGTSSNLRSVSSPFKSCGIFTAFWQCGITATIQRRSIAATFQRKHGLISGFHPVFNYRPGIFQPCTIREYLSSLRCTFKFTQKFTLGKPISHSIISIRDIEHISHFSAPASSGIPTGTNSSVSLSRPGNGSGGYPQTTLPSLSSSGRSYILASNTTSKAGSSPATSGLISGITSSAIPSGIIVTSSISTVYSTNIYTVTSCAPTVKDCPFGQVTTELVSISTAIRPITNTIGVDEPEITSSAPPMSTGSLSSSLASNTSAASFASSSLGPVISSFSSVLATPSTNRTLNSTGTTVPPIQLLPTTYSVSTRITSSTLSTVYSTNIVKVTSCAPTVTDCPTGQVTTETVSLYTTMCPVTKDIIDGTTYTQIDTVTPSTPLPSSGTSSSTSSVKSPSPTSSGVSTSAVPSVETSLIQPNFTGPFVNTTISVSRSFSVRPTMIASNSSTVPTTPPVMTTSTVYSTNVYTLTSCAPEVANCSKGKVTTELVSLYTTVCPVEQVQTTTEPAIQSSTTPGPSKGVKFQSPPSPSESSIVASSEILPASKTTATGSRPSMTSFTTSTVYSTNVYTITSCAPEVSNCPVSIGQVTTEVVAISTTVCPVTEVADKKTPSPAPEGPYSTTVVTFSNTFGSSVIVVTSTMSFIDTPAPSPQSTTAAPETETSAVAPGLTSVPQSKSKPCTTLTLGKYFTTVIEYESITARPPAKVTPGSSLVTSIYSQPPAPEEPQMDVPNYQMSPGDSTLEMGSFSAPPPTSPAPGNPSSSANTAPKNVAEPTTTRTKPVTNQLTVTRPMPGLESGACVCEPTTISVTVTAAAPPTFTVTSTVQPPFYPSGGAYETGTAPPGTGGTGTVGTGYATMSTDMPLRRWFRRGYHGHGHGHGH